MTNMPKRTEEKLRAQLFSMQDEKYRSFHSRLMPTVPKELVIGVRTPALRSFAKSLADSDEREFFLSVLPHRYYDENNLHAFFIEQEKDTEKCLGLLDVFLPFVDNWATCDMMNPKALGKNKNRLFEKSLEWIASDKVYTVRYGIRMLMVYFLGEDFKKGCLDIVASIRSDEYYVNMMIAWFFATALTKQYSHAVRYIEERKLSTFCHNKAISKACDSFCIDKKTKEYLKSLRISEK